ncbi:MAG: NAD-dependent deacetylase [Candidatus Hodarchaeota archaeon]
MSIEENIKTAAKLIHKSKYIVVFTGAGISTESGISDFRSPSGLWSRYDPGEYAEYRAFLNHPEKFWTMHKEMSQTVLEAEPNQAHKSLVKLEKNYGKLKAIITQNIDFLHSRAGSKNVLEIHGSGYTAVCLDCRQEFHYLDVQRLLDKGQIVPRCVKCKGLIKPNVVLFGEPLPYDIVQQARDEINTADLLIVIGSSLTVYPAAALPSMALNTGARIIIINVEPTMMDHLVDVVIHGKAGEILPKILNELEKLDRTSISSNDS